jgi:hypothetical protein
MHRISIKLYVIVQLARVDIHRIPFIELVVAVKMYLSFILYCT